MRNLILIALFLCFVNCSAQQQVSQVPLTRTVAKVTTIIAGKAVLQPYGSSVSYTVPLPDEAYIAKKGPIVSEWQYVFWLDVQPCTCTNKQAVIADYAITTQQAVTNMENAAERLSHRKIIKK